MSLVGLLRAWNEFNHDGPQARTLYGYAALINVLTVPVAAFCVYASAELLMKPHFKLTVHNTAARKIDKVTFQFDGGDETFGPLKPGATETQRVRSQHQGPLFMITRVAGKDRRKMDRIFRATEQEFDQAYDIYIEDHELPQP
jgi:hypothetical protein